MDPLSAFGLAANIFQVLEFSCKIVTSGIEISKSPTGSSEKTFTLKSIGSKLKSLSDDLVACSTETKTGREVHDLATECHKVAQELLDVLGNLRFHGKPGKWQSLRMAFLETRINDRIEAISDRLAKLQAQLTVHLLKILDDKQSELSREFAKLSNECQRFNRDNAFQLQNMQKEIISNIRKVSLDAYLNNQRIDCFWESARQLEAIEQVDVSLLSARIETLSKSITNLVARGHEITIENRILQSLSFSEIRQRHQDIPNAHASTFQWMIDQSERSPPSRGKFVRWVKKDSGVFWIHGKPGSGKSTLMKFISQHTKTIQILREWTGSNMLVAANYFFWSSGSRLQKTLDGLLRSLLFDILLACPHFIHQLLSDLESSTLDKSSWSREELVRAIKQLTAGDNTTVRFAFFIDGLDEYGGDYCDELIEVIKELGSSPSIKLCISSRPWNEFMDAFGSNPDLTIRLEDLTKIDIRNYVQKTLEENPIYQIVRSRDRRYPHLIKEIVILAQGVFLWVVLVVRSLIRGLTNADRIPDLQMRLRSLPPTLEEFFEHMLNSVESIYKEQSARTLFLALEAEQPLLLMIYSFADEDEDFAMTVKVQEMATHEIKWRQEQMRKRINGRTKGILEVNLVSDRKSSDDYGKYQVDFLHRTARDFIQKSTAVHKLLGSPDDYHAISGKTLQRAFLTQLKLAPSTEKTSSGEQTINKIMYHTNKARLAASHQSLRILKEVESLFCSFSKPRELLDPWKTFSHMAIVGGMTSYVREILDCDPGRLNSSINQLLRYKLHTDSSAEYSPGTDIIELLVANDTRPHGMNGKWTLWQALMSNIHDNIQYIAEKDILVMILEVLVRSSSSDADLRALCIEERQGANYVISAEDIIRREFSYEDAERIFARNKSKQERKLGNELISSTKATLNRLQQDDRVSRRYTTQEMSALEPALTSILSPVPLTVPQSIRRKNASSSLRSESHFGFVKGKR